MNRINSFLIVTGVVLCLAQIWLPQYYLTGDGPSHVYNAKMLHDYWTGENVAFYDHFYNLGRYPNPNWISHIIMAILMYVVNGLIAEKILLSGYILLFVSGGIRLSRRLSGASTFWPLIIFIFVFNRLLVAGFYNFSISVAFFLWVTEVWLSYLEDGSTRKIVLFFLFTLLVYFSHPLAFVFGCLTCFSITCTYCLSRLPGANRSASIKLMIRKLAVLLLCFAPCLILFVIFVLKEGGAGSIHLHLFQYRFHDLVRSDYLVNYTFPEGDFVKYMGLLLYLSFPVSLFIRYKHGFRIHKYDGFLVSLLFAVFLYKCFPDNMLGGGSMNMRSMYFLSISLACCISYMLPPGKLKNVFSLILFSFFIFLSIYRMNVMRVASKAEEDYQSAGKFIRPNSVVLPLDFAPNGSDNGKMIADKMYLYSHASQYMGIQKPLIILDNYEASQGYFPFTWKESVNPYYHLGKHAGIEGWPPCATIAEYKSVSGVTVDYILMWCYNPSYLRNSDFNALYQEILSRYHIIYKSPTERTILYEKNEF